MLWKEMSPNFSLDKQQFRRTGKFNGKIDELCRIIACVCFGIDGNEAFKYTLIGHSHHSNYKQLK